LALSSAKVSSVSSCLGTSTPARRATAPLAVSQAICTWRFIGNMFGKRRQLVNTVGSILLASACACALSRIAERFLSMFGKRGVLAWYMEMFMEASELGNGGMHFTAARAPKGAYRGQTFYLTSCAKMSTRPITDISQASVRIQIMPAT